MILADTPSNLSSASGSVWDFFTDGGPFMVLLILLSILSITVIIHKALGLRRETVMPLEIADELGRAEIWAEKGDLNALGGMMQHTPSALSRIGLFAMTGHAQDREEARESVQANAREEIVHLESGIALLEVVIAVAPLMGLLGTVSGLVGVFSSLDPAGDAEHARIAGGIAEALNTTIAGLAVAVPTVFAHSYFAKKIEKMAVRMEVLIGHLVNVLYRPLPEPACETEHAPAPERTPAPEPKPKPEPEPEGESAYALSPSPSPSPEHMHVSPHEDVPEPEDESVYGQEPEPEPASSDFVEELDEDEDADADADIVDPRDLERSARRRSVMEFVIRKRTRPVVPIISLIDILAILLIFFVATSTFKEKKSAVNINLPKAKALALELTPDERVALRVQSAERIEFDNAPVELESLGAMLAAFRDSRPDGTVELFADEEIPIKTMFAVWEALTEAGFPIKEVPTRIQVTSDKPSSTPAP